jgi:hypothetical protein
MAHFLSWIPAIVLRVVNVANLATCHVAPDDCEGSCARLVLAKTLICPYSHRFQSLVANFVVRLSAASWNPLLHAAALLSDRFMHSLRLEVLFPRDNVVCTLLILFYWFLFL